VSGAVPEDDRSGRDKVKISTGRRVWYALDVRCRFFNSGPRLLTRFLAHLFPGFRGGLLREVLSTALIRPSIQ
jgi:hypothetical protein